MGPPRDHSTYNSERILKILPIIDGEIDGHSYINKNTALPPFYEVC